MCRGLRSEFSRRGLWVRPFLLSLYPHAQVILHDVYHEDHGRQVRSWRNLHRAAVKRAVFPTGEPNCLLTCGEDGLICRADPREDRGRRICKVLTQEAEAASLHCLSIPEAKPWMLAVASGCGTVFVLDRRMIPPRVHYELNRSILP